MEVSIGIYALLHILFFLIIPGFIARRSYYNGEFSKQIVWSGNSLANLISSIFIGILVSLLCIGGYNLISNNDIDLDKTLSTFDSYFISNNANGNNIFSGFNNLIYKKYIPYLGSIYLLSSIFGFLANQLVLIFGLDLKLKILRFSNNWHYLFSGRILKIKKNDIENDAKTRKVKYTYLDVLVSEKGDETTLYSGLFADYDLSHIEVNKLDRLYLFKAIRYKKSDAGVEQRHIPGSIFTILGERILNINCTYICVDEAEMRDRGFKTKRNILILAQSISLIVFIAMTISFFFSFNLIGKEWYQDILKQSFITKLLTLFFTNLIFGFLTPFEINNKEKKVKLLGSSSLLALLILSITFGGLVYFLWE